MFSFFVLLMSKHGDFYLAMMSWWLLISLVFTHGEILKYILLKQKKEDTFNYHSYFY